MITVNGAVAMLMKVFEFLGAEIDWVAASDEAEARSTLMAHYGISVEDLVGSYEEVNERDPADVQFHTDAVDAETEESVMTTAAAMMIGKTKPFALGSTAN
jgi:hypothetical protein